MNITKVILFGAGFGLLGVTLYEYFRKQATLLSNVSYKVVGLSITKFTIDNISLTLRLQFQSNADFEANVQQVYLDVYVNGKAVGFINNTTPFLIPAHGTNYVNLNLSFSPKILLSNIVDVLFSSLTAKDLAIKLDGYARVNSGFIGARLPVTYETTLNKYLIDNGKNNA